MIVLKLSLVSGRRTFFGRGNEIHYIGGTEILPAPLDTAEEQKMIHMLGTVNEETARSMLIERNLRLVVYIAKKFDNTGIGVEDLISIGTIGLIKAINTFNPAKKIKLATYASDDRIICQSTVLYLFPIDLALMRTYINSLLCCIGWFLCTPDFACCLKYHKHADQQ